ncbi:exopolysaccharide production repressor protein [Rhizobium tubonense]|nr:exopolysaccharide production repressor protein [Rhizobium tubonense]
MIATLVFFAIVTYFITQSLSTTFLETALCAILLQTGYFAGVLFLIRNSEKGRREALSGASVATGVGPNHSDEKSGSLPPATMNRTDPVKY